MKIVINKKIINISVNHNLLKHFYFKSLLFRFPIILFSLILLPNLLFAENGMINFLDQSGNSSDCITYSEVPIPFDFTGADTLCWETTGTIDNINSWNLDYLEINGVVLTNQYTENLPDKIDGKYYISFVSSVAWGHFDMDGNQIYDGFDGLDCETNSELIIPSLNTASGEYCWVACGDVLYVNSWNLDKLEINGVDYTNTFSFNMPDKIDGKYFIHFVSSVPWGHFRIIGTGSGPCVVERPEACDVTFSEIQNIGLNSSGDNWGASWGDYNGDGQVDLVVTNDAGDAPNELYRNNGNGTFTKITSGPIATDIASSLGASWADYDNDQDLDLIISNNIGEPNFLYRNEGGNNFIRIYNDPIVDDIGYSHGVSWADYDNDGFLDLFVATYFSTKFNSLYHNNGDGTFSKITDNTIAMEASNSTSGFWGDYNNDGLIDLFVANTLGDNNSLYENKGNGKFLKINAGAIVNDGGLSVGASWGDMDNDGDLDLFVANAGDEDNFLYQNNGNGSFTKVTNSVVVHDQGHSHGSGWADFNNDGWLDLFVTNDQNQDNFLYENNKDGTFNKVVNSITQNAGQSFGTAWADYNNDGKLDLFVANREGNPNFLYKNESAGCSNSIGITLFGSHSNRSAVGAKVYVTATIDGQEITQLREITAQSGGGIAGQSEFRATFGLGDASSADLITIKWPSGHEQSLTNQNVNNNITIQEENGSVVCGNIFNDENGNCNNGGTEPGVVNQKMIITPGNHVVYTDANGDYEAILPIGTYDILLEPLDNWSKSCSGPGNKTVVKVKKLGTRYCGFDFGVIASCLAPDMSVESAVTSHRVGFENLISLTYANKGTTEANNVVLKLTLDDACIALNSTIPWESQSGQELMWFFETVPAGFKQTIYITDSVDANTPIGQELSLTSTVESTEVDCDESDNSFIGLERTIGALDPNDILVFPEGSIRKDEVLTYKIRFQNVGNIPVSRVRVESELPAELDKYTFELGVGSHPFKFNQNGRTLNWEFPNINLPDSINNEPESHGYVTFRARPKTNLSIGSEIENSANIFFDNMAPIATNVVSNIILPDLATEKFGGKLMVYPNPTRGNMNIQLIPHQFGQQPDIMRHLFVYNMLGQPIKSYYNLKDDVLNWDATGLPAGFYLIKAINQKGEEFDTKVYVLE